MMGLRTGDWVKFSLPDPLKVLVPVDDDPQKPKASTGPMFQKGVIDDEDQVKMTQKQMHMIGSKYIGIYTGAAIDPLTHRPVPATITPVQKDTGKNIRFLHNGMAALVQFAVEDVRDLEEVVDRSDVPKGRLATAHKDWVPRAGRLRGVGQQQSSENREEKKSGKRR